ncbi:MAG: hypothetical protein LBI05_05410 [Planctomycetaceae bacterium]|jgi:hypothetical protein|nr:hypothetical protein [Planctomycetaceae bacterium]
MRLYFAPIFSVLFAVLFASAPIAVVQADQYAFPPPLAPLEPFAPLLPKQDQAREEGPAIIRGQSRAVSDLAVILETPPPFPKGPVGEGTIDPKLIEPSATESDLDKYAEEMAKNSAKANAANQNPEMADPLAHSVLLAATGVLTIALVYMAFVAYDCRQRWMQSLTAQNDRYLGSGMFDMETEDTYSSGSVSFSEGFGLPHHSI